MDNGEFDIGAAVGRLMSDPKVAELIKELKEGDKGGAETTAADKGTSSAGGAADAYERLPEIINTLSPMLKGGGRRQGSEESERRNRLLAALKPYLNQNRQATIDSLMSYSKLTSLLDLFPDKK